MNAMRVFAISDIHADFAPNARWIADVSTVDYRNDILILAGDVTDRLPLLGWCLSTLAARFRKVLFVPGNHELWVVRDGQDKTSWQKLEEVTAVAASSGASMQPLHADGVSIFPLLSWYDYSFGEPSAELESMWMDFHACRWPEGSGVKDIALRLAGFNDRYVASGSGKTITFSHFLPRRDLLPQGSRRVLDPVLGTMQLDRQLRLLNPSIHVYGHSHINRNVQIDGISYINNAFGYPHETWMTSRRLLCIHDMS